MEKMSTLFLPRKRQTAKNTKKTTGYGLLRTLTPEGRETDTPLERRVEWAAARIVGSEPRRHARGLTLVG